LNLTELFLSALIFIFPAYCTNAAPVIFGGGGPIDCGKSFIDGKPLFGSHKTVRGFISGLASGILATIALCYLVPYNRVMLFGSLQLFCRRSPLNRGVDRRFSGIFHKEEAEFSAWKIGSGTGSDDFRRIRCHIRVCGVSNRNRNHANRICCDSSLSFSYEFNCLLFRA